jgi:phytoene/squalene synthetase
MVSKADTTKNPTGLDLYLEAAQRSSSVVISAYSTSFGLASKLLAPKIRRHVENIYALVRVADEIVDGSAAKAKEKGGSIEPSRALDELERDVYRAFNDRFSTNLVVHAFAHTANATGFGRDITQPFFDSMRMDLWKNRHDQKSFEKYVYGSAEVVGLMCLHAFLEDVKVSQGDRKKMVAGARALGAAFQKVNFLRDLSADARGLGRSYFPGIYPERFTEEQKLALVADIDADLAISKASIPLLPRGAKRAVIAAHELFAELNRRIGNTPAEQVINTRISVPNFSKLIILVRAWLGISPK